MLLARFKSPSRLEYKKFVWKESKDTFVYKGVTYHIDPNCIYIVKILDFFKFRCIDYVMGNGNPIRFYDVSNMRDSSKKNLDTVSHVIKTWIASTQKMILYMFYMLLGSLILSGAACFLIYMVYSKIGGS